MAATSVATSGGAFAAAPTHVDIPAPTGTTAFPYAVFVLKNGNFVVTDPFSGVPASNAGAVFLYSGATHALISTLTGSSANDKVGSNGIVELTNGNFVVLSGGWHNGAAAAGAVTWVNGVTGLNGTVTAANSLVGTQSADAVGDTSIDSNAVVPLTNGNYVVTAPNWANGGLPRVGAATWAKGDGTTVGPINVTNSLYGLHAFDLVGLDGTIALTNGDYVVSSGSAATAGVSASGAVTWGDGTAPMAAAVGTTNSLYGDTANQFVGSGGAVALRNGNYVVSSPRWNSGTAHGAATWLSGAGPTATVVTSANSLHGSVVDDLLGDQVFPLTNGNYVVTSPAWGTNHVGAATWGNGASGTSGTIDATNSLVGSSLNDAVGSKGVTPLPNGNYVVGSPQWFDGVHPMAGAATWSSGTAAVPTGPVTSANSLVGSSGGDQISSEGITALSNSNFVVNSSSWGAGRGAATFGNGTVGSFGTVSATNSLVGALGATDHIAQRGTLALKNGGYVVQSPGWKNGTAAAAGAATWGNSATGVIGLVTTTNSLVGSSPNDQIGYDAVALDDGNYVTSSQFWSNGLAAQVGASTWGNGATGVSGPVTAADSLIGNVTNDHVSDGGVVPVTGGHYGVLSVSWNNGSIAAAGAESFGGPGGIVGPITAANSLLGTVTADSGVISSRRIGDGSIAIARPTVHVVTLYNDGFGGGDYIPLPPARLADTRVGHTTADGLFAGIGVRAAASVLELPVAGRGGVPADAAAVTLNVTATEATADGFVTVYPCGSPQPTASNLNYTAGSTIPNAVITKLGDGGKVCIFAQQSLQLVVDVDGAFPMTTSYKAINPARLLDTRVGHTTIDGQQQATGPVAADSVTPLKVSGRAGVPADAGAVVLNVTVTEPTVAGYATVYPCGTQPPTASNLNYVPGQTIPNLVIAKVGSGGSVCIFTQNGTQLVADVLGYFPAATTFTALVPARLLDTRTGHTTIDGQGSGVGVLPIGTITKVHVTGRGGVPANAATAVLNVTVTEPVAAGFVTVYPCGIDAPLASNLNYAPGQTIPNAVIAKVGTNGDVCIINSQPLQLVADVTGYFP